jgi:hypothetical protein
VKPGAQTRACPAHTVTHGPYLIKLDDMWLYVWSGEFHYWPAQPGPVA